MEQLNLTLPAYNDAAAAAAKARWDTIAKPLGSLGLLEAAVVKMAGLTGDADFYPAKKGVLVMCADNGVVRQGVTQTGSEVTAIVANNITVGDASVCRMAAVAKAEVTAVDMGMLEEQATPGLVNRRIAAGTGDISLGPAMSRDEAIAAIKHGIDLVGEKKQAGFGLLATGEMGIGNTTTSAAMAAMLLGCAPEVVTGRGAGLSTEGLRRKTEVVKQAIEVNNPNPDDALDVLAKLGGFDIAGICGIFLGGAVHKVPVLVDGLISAVGALTALRLYPATHAAMLASHVSAEPAGAMLLQALDLKPLINAGMYLGEGTGAVAAMPLLDMAYAVYGGMRTFDEIEIESYQPLE